MAPVNAATACDINVCKELWVGGCVASIVQDAKAIYWSEQTGGIVWKLAK
jgi:hypothetical protein